MKTKILSSLSLVLVSGLLLAGCSTDNGENPDDTVNTEENNTATAPTYEDKWGDEIPEELLFPTGEYAFTYRENNTQEGLPTWNGTGVIGFYEDGTCAFSFDGVKVTVEGEEIPYTIGKFRDDSPFMANQIIGYWTSDQLTIEADYRTNFPSMGAFPRHTNFGSFCSLQALDQITSFGAVERGNRVWTVEGGEEFAKKGKEWFLDYNLEILKIEEADKAEALEILELMYYGTENIFTFDGEVRVETAEDGVVTIVNGIEGETSIFSEFIFTPLTEEMVLEFETVGGLETVTTRQMASGYLNEWGSGIEYLRYMQSLYDEFVGSGADS